MNIKLGHKITDHAELKQFGYLLARNLMERNGSGDVPLSAGDKRDDRAAEVSTTSEAKQNAGKPARE